MRFIIGTVLLSSIVTSVIEWAIPHEVMYRMVCITVMMLTVWWCYRTSVLYSLVITVMTLVLAGSMDIVGGYGTSALLGITYHELVWKKELYTVLVSVCKLLELFICYMIRKLQHGRKHETIRTSWLFLTALFPLFSYALMLFIFLTFQTRGDLSVYGVIFSGLLILVNIAILYILNILEKRTREEEELHLMNQQIEIQTKSFLALEKSYRAQRAATHEFRNQLQTLGDLLSAGQADKAHEYILRLQQSESVRDLPVRTHHAIMDAILNQKYQLALEHGIDIQFRVSDLSGLRMETDALVLLFANLLDNAIEACQRLEGNRAIRCTVIHEDGLFLSVKNTAPPVSIERGAIRTTKHPSQEHGFGLLSIQRVLKEHHGEYSFDYRDGWFRFAAEIPEV